MTSIQKRAAYNTFSCLIGILVFAVLFFSPSWSNPFVFDDIIKIQENSDLKQGTSLWESLVYPYQPHATTNLRNDPSRPLTFLIYRACYQLADGAPWPFHLVSTLVHALNGMLVFLLTGLLARKLFNSTSVVPGLIAALFFLLTPINSGTVLYAYAFSDVLGGFFLLASLYVFSRSFQFSSVLLFLSLLCFTGGLLSKQSVIVLPALLIVTDLLLGQFNKKRIFSYLCFFLIGGIYVVARYKLLGGIGDLEGVGNTFAPLHYLSTQGLLILGYFVMSFAPFRLSIDHALRLQSFQTWELALGWTVVLLITALSTWFLLRKNSARMLRLLSSLWLIFLICLLPTSSFLPTVDLFVERRSYASSAALAAALGLLLTLYTFRKYLVGGLTVLLLSFFGLLSWNRMDIYASNEALWKESVALYPQSKRAQVNLGVIYTDLGRWTEAKDIYARALAQFPNDAFIHTKLALLYQNPLFKEYNPQRSLEHYQQALRRLPYDIVTLYNVGLLLIEMNQFEAAEGSFLKALDVNPRFAPAVSGLGMLRVRQGKIEEARAEFLRALSMDPKIHSAREALERLNRP